MTGDARDADDLAPFFAAARAAAPAPRVALIDAVLADAADVAAGRARPTPAPRRRRWPGLFAPIGGWRGATALAACVALGLWVGLLGGGDLAAAAMWSDAGPDDPVDAFFDLAAVEG